MAYFSKYGELVKGYVIYDPFTSESKGSGIVEFKDSKSLDFVLSIAHFIKDEQIEIIRFRPRGVRRLDTEKAPGDPLEKGPGQDLSKKKSKGCNQENSNLVNNLEDGPALEQFKKKSKGLNQKNSDLVNNLENDPGKEQTKKKSKKKR